RFLYGLMLIVFFALAGCAQTGAGPGTKAIPREHPLLLGPVEYLRELAGQRAESYARMAEMARGQRGGGHERMLSMGLVCAIEGDESIGRQAVEMALEYVEGPIRVGHVRFGDDLARCALVYDLCHRCWTDEERLKFHEYMNKTVDDNVRSETTVFHNGWYSYKHWGIGLAALATYYENERAPAILEALVQEYRERVIPAFALAGDGGGWAEGYYINYWSYEWMFFCEAARRCAGLDLFAMSLEFLGKRAVAGMFEAYPVIGDRGSYRPIPIGDSGGRIFGSDRDKTLSTRRILVNRFRDDPSHQAVHAFNETTPRSGASTQAYKDFLWRDTTVVKGDLKKFKLSHLSRGPGFVYARSSWDQDATYFFFKCGDRFTSHQHLDVGNFLIYKYGELAGDGGHYSSFGDEHDANYHLRTIAHNTVLVYDPEESWTNIRAWKGETGNDGGQMHEWPHHNGSVEDADAWYAGREVYDIADLLAYEDRGAYLYVAGDCSRAYSPKKLEYFTRQIIFIRPGMFIIFDRVKSTDPSFKKTWLLQAMKPPVGVAPNLEITNGRGKLFIQTVLPRNPRVELFLGDNLYSYGGKNYPPGRNTGPAPECRVEVSPGVPSEVDYFLHVLTATEVSVLSAPKAEAVVTDTEVIVSVGEARISFSTAEAGGTIEVSGSRSPLARGIVR
ncbi:MAG: heparinase II/III family protein, partial [Gemmatimonadota bacterium]|nr:heparinase II/III family protein [Gemmatimonadota bacterium]